MEELWNGSTLAQRRTRGLVELPATVKATLYARERRWKGADMLAAINDPAAPLHMIHHLGHAINDTNMQLENADVGRMTNDFPFFQVSQGCYSGAFDNIDHHVAPVDAFAEHLVVEEHGAFATIQNSRYGWGSRGDTLGPSQMYHRALVDALVAGKAHLGHALNEAKSKNAWDIDGDCMRWCFYELNLLGDPETQLRACEPAPHAEAGPDQVVELGGSVLLGTAAVEGTTYEWAPATGLSCTDCAQPTGQPASTTEYTLTARNECGAAQDSVRVAVDQRPTATFTQPAASQVVGGQQMVVIEASDPDGQVAKVVLTLPGQGEVTVSSAPYAAIWDTSAQPDGPAQLTAVAYDDLGMASQPAVVEVTVANSAPTPAILSFTASSQLVGSGEPVVLQWQTADAVALSLTANRVPLDVSGQPVADGSITVTPTMTTTYELTACGDPGCLHAARAVVWSS